MRKEGEEFSEISSLVPREEDWMVEEEVIEDYRIPKRSYVDTLKKEDLYQILMTSFRVKKIVTQMNSPRMGFRTTTSQRYEWKKLKLVCLILW